MRKLALHAVGIRSGVGGDAPATMAMIYSRLSPRTELPFGNQSASVAAVACEAELAGTKRLLAMGQSALDEIAGADMPWPLPLVFSCPGEDEIPRPAANLLTRLATAKPDLVAKQRQVIVGGSRALPAAFAAVEKILVSGIAPACVLLAVDSFLDPSRLAIAERRQGLRSMDRPGGILPGEAAVALLCSLGDKVKDRPQVVSLAVGEVGAGNLPGAALSATVERALADAAVGADQIKAVVHDMAGSKGMEELYSMMSKVPLPAIDADGVYAPADTVGETGAASDLLGVAAMAFLREKKVFDGAGLCIASDEAGFRSVAVVR
jgi:3-oxoacyl-[acyl-carrier-protein] synthase-1